MKKTVLLTALALGLLLVNCVGSKSNKPVSENTKTEEKEVAMDTIEIEPLAQKEYKIKVGQKISYSYTEHPSVGSTGEYEVGDEAVLVFKDKKRAYKNPKNAEMAGGDEATVTLIFKGGKVGSSSLIIRDMFRGKTENEFELKVIVE